MTEQKTDSWLSEALADDRFVLYCQPIVELASGEVCQREILLRLADGAAHIGPEYFLPTAERLGVVSQLDGMVVAKSIAILEAGLAPVLDVNLSGASLGDPDLLKLISSSLESTGVDPNRLVIEITETAAIGDMAAAVEFLRTLHDLGCRLALDDFGIGFSSLYYLKHLPLDFVKIDGEFIRDLTTNERDLVVVKGIVALARDLGLKTIAEFVPDDATVQKLREIGVDCGQGYHLGEPAPAPLPGGDSRPPPGPAPAEARHN